MFLLYSTKKECQEIIRKAKKLGLTTKEYVWIVTQPSIGADLEAPLDLVPGMLGVHFETKKVGFPIFTENYFITCLDYILMLQQI